MAKIYIDPGHGGHDGGASGSGLVEKNWVLEISLELAKVLRKLGHTVRLSRTNDTFISLNARSADSNRWGADIFISIHFNAGGGYGWEDFIFDGRVSSETRKLQNEIHEAIKPVLAKHGMRNRGKKRANFSVLRQTSAPAILIEGGFVDTTDNAIMKKASYKKDLVNALANGVQKHLGLSIKTTVVEAGWQENNTGWWYQNADGSYPRNRWMKIKEIWYYFGKHGYISIGWRKINNAWYYFHTNGRMLTGWQKVKGTWYYLNSNGSMAIGWKKVSGKWYYLHTNGAMRTGLLEVNGKHYYLERNGALITEEAIEVEANKHGHLS